MSVIQATEHLDVLIIGAGVSGIGAAWHLQHNLPDKSYRVLEARDQLGGTWDLFRYPGMHTFDGMRPPLCRAMTELRGPVRKAQQRALDGSRVCSVLLFGSLYASRLAGASTSRFLDVATRCCARVW